MAQWLDDTLRTMLENRKQELTGQLAEIDHILDGRSSPVPANHRVVRAGRNPLSAEAKKKLSKRMKQIWRDRKAKQGTP